MDLTYLYQLQDANFSYLLNRPTEVAVIDMDDAALTARQIDTLQARGQVLLTYVSIGEAEDYRDYWVAGGWSAAAPDFLLSENPDWEGNYRVKFWDEDWQRVVTTRVEEAVRLGYDGIYLDIVDAYQVSSVEARYDGADIRQEMIDFVIALSERARELAPDFLIVPQNAVGLLAASEDSANRPNEAYLRAIDGIGVEDLWYDDDVRADWTAWDLDLIELAQAADKFVLATSYPSSPDRRADFVENALAAGLIPYVGTRELDGAVPPINFVTPDRIGARDLELPSQQGSGGAGTGLLKIGGTGADVLMGGSGDDTLIGWGGRDTLNGGGGADTVRGGAGPDLLRGSAGDDRLTGGWGNDEVHGGWGNDAAWGGAGQDVLRGWSGDDTLEGGAGRDWLMGGTGRDRLVFDEMDAALWGGQGFDTLAASGGFDIDLGASAFRPGFEALDLANGALNIASIARGDILRKAGNDTLFVTGDRGDRILTDMGPQDDAARIGGIDYAVFESGDATLYIELGLTVNGNGTDWM